METQTEYRFLQDGELRASGPGKITGYAAIFNSPSLPLGPQGFTERIRQGAFSSSMSSDVLALYNHDTEKLLGRTSSGTMLLREDDTGLKTEIRLPDTQLGRDVHTLVSRHDLRGMSFGFHVLSDRWNPSRTERELLAIELHEVSVVAKPAYPSAVIEARSLGLPAGVEVLTYQMPGPVTDAERERLRLRVELLRRL